MGRRATIRCLGLATLAALAAACGGSDTPTFDSRPATSSAPGADGSAGPARPEDTSSSSVGTPTPPADSDVEVRIDASAPGAAISPLILGVSSTLTAAELQDAGLTLNSWGGNPATRFNYMNGHAWNHGSDYEFRNTNYGVTSGDALRITLDTNAEAGVMSRVAVPTLGWVAKNDDTDVCSFPNGDGGCLPASEVGTCSGDGPVADPTTANVPSTPEGVAEYVRGLVADGYDLDIIAMDNEPDLWGVTHYDVHPRCPTYEEVLDTYLTYASAVRAVAPDAKLAGPVMCCWYDYWGTAPGPADDSEPEDFLTWFLTKMKEHDDQTGERLLDYVDVHYYPQSDVFNDEIDESTSARRLRSTQSLWDPDYVDESWIGQTIRFIPRMRETIEATYPGTPMIISEWSFGAEETVNGADAIAEVLGIYGREGVDAAAYWRHPDVGTPGWFAFKMHGNYDSQGSRFGGSVVSTITSASDRVNAFGALDTDAGLLRVMLINKSADTALTAGVGVAGVSTTSSATAYSWSPDDAAIVSSTVDITAPVALAPSSITVLELQLA